MQCSVKRYSGRGKEGVKDGGGCKTLKANRNIVSKNFLEGIRGIVGETLATDFPLSGLSFNFAIEQHGILYSINLKLYN